MKKKHIILASVLVVLAAANIIGRWAVPGGDKENKSATGKNSAVVIRLQDTVTDENMNIYRNLFEGPAVTAGLKPVQAAKPAPDTARIEPVRWPEFRVSGTAELDGKKVIFFSGRAFKGQVFEGENITESFILVSADGDRITVRDSVSGETRTYQMEAR